MRKAQTTAANLAEDKRLLLLSIAVYSFVPERCRQYRDHLKAIKVVIPGTPFLRSENAAPILPEVGVSETPPLQH